MALDLNEHAFPIGQVALFFDQTTGWLRWREDQDLLKDEKGNPLGKRRRNNKLGGGDRVFSLDDVREIAHSFRRRGVLDDDNLKIVIERIDAFAKPVETGRLAKTNGKK